MDSKNFELNECSSIIPEVCVLDADIHYFKQLHQLHNDYLPALGKT